MRFSTLLYWHTILGFLILVTLANFSAFVSFWFVDFATRRVRFDIIFFHSLISFRCFCFVINDFISSFIILSEIFVLFMADHSSVSFPWVECKCDDAVYFRGVRRLISGHMVSVRRCLCKYCLYLWWWVCRWLRCNCYLCWSTSVYVICVDSCGVNEICMDKICVDNFSLDGVWMEDICVGELCVRKRVINLWF